MAPKVGDLVIVSYAWDRRGLYLELRDSNRKTFYSIPRQVMDAEDMALILEIEDEDARIVTFKGQHGWIPIDFLLTVSEYDRRFVTS